eukprot:g17768.t1
MGFNRCQRQEPKCCPNPPSSPHTTCSSTSTRWHPRSHGADWSERCRHNPGKVASGAQVADKRQQGRATSAHAQGISLCHGFCAPAGSRWCSRGRHFFLFCANSEAQ